MKGRIGLALLIGVALGVWLAALFIPPPSPCEVVVIEHLHSIPLSPAAQ